MSYESPIASRLTAELGTTAAGHFAQALDERSQPPALVPQHEAPWRIDLAQQISSMTPEQLCGGSVKDLEGGKAVKSGLLLWNDDLDSSHTISQSLQGPTGSYWHGIMHRREPDYSNAKYWFHQFGEHPIFPELKEAAVAVAGHLELEEWQIKIESSYEWNAIQFIDWCQDAGGGRLTAVQLQFLRLTQLEEIRLLLIHSYRQAQRRR